METPDKNVSFFRFEDLRIYDKANDYCSWLLQNLLEPINAGDLHLIESFCRSAFDISLNIAEGASRNKNQFDHYLKIAKTAVRECYVYTTIAQKSGLMKEECAQTSCERLMEMTRMIGALIVSLQRPPMPRATDTQVYDEPTSDNEPIDALDAIETNF